MSLLKELVNFNQKNNVVEQDDPWDRGYLDGLKGRTVKVESLYPDNKENQEQYLEGANHGVNDRKAKVNEMDFAFGGSKPQPSVTDGPTPPEGETFVDTDAGGDDNENGYGDYADYENGGEDSPLEGEDHLTLEIPFFIRMLEWSREDAQSDEEVHQAVENLLALEKSPLTMDDYDAAIEGIGGDDGMGDEMGGDEFDDVESELGANDDGEMGGEMGQDEPPVAAENGGKGSVFRMG